MSNNTPSRCPPGFGQGVSSQTQNSWYSQQTANQNTRNPVSAMNQATRMELAHTAMEALLTRAEGYIMTEAELAEKAWNYSDAVIAEGQKRGVYL